MLFRSKKVWSYSIIEVSKLLIKLLCESDFDLKSLGIVFYL